MSCGNCGTTNGEIRVEAWIQACAGETPLFSNSVNGDYPAITFSNLKPARKGKITKKRKKDASTGNWVVCVTTEDAPGDATIDLEIEACGCAGYAPRELEDLTFNAFFRYYCCDELVYTKNVTAIQLQDGTWDKLNDFSQAYDGKLTYSGALFSDEFDTYPLTFSEIAVSAGLTTGQYITDICWWGATKSCSGKGCGKGCQDRWAAISNGGQVTYKANKTTGLQVVQISPGFSSGTANPKIVEYNGKLYAAFGDTGGFGYFYATLDAAGNPGNWTQIIVGANSGYAVDDMFVDGQGVTVLVHDTLAVSHSYKITSGGQFTLSNNVFHDAITAADICGSVVIGGTYNGKVVTRSCGAWSAVTTAPSTVQIYAAAIRDDEYWVGDSAGKVYKSSDSGVSWTQVGMPAASTAISSIQWANSLVGYVVSASPAAVFATTDGGASWEDTTGHISANISGAQGLNVVAVPCCDNPTTAANNVLVGGLTTGAVAGVWQGKAKTC